MSGFIKGEDRRQATLFPERLDDYVTEDSPVRVIDVFIDDLDISGLGFKTEASDTGRPAYHPDNTQGVDMPPKGGNPALTDDDLLAIIAFQRTWN